MIKYKHLTEKQRVVIEVLIKRGCSLKGIAIELGVHVTTVSREIKNRGRPNGYFSDIANLDYELRKRHNWIKRKMCIPDVRDYVIDKLKIGWSPEQISGRLRLCDEHRFYVCPETIYQYIYDDKVSNRENLYQYLRYGKKKRKKRNGRSVHSCKIPNRVSIHSRPDVVAQRVEFGHWEGDSVIYPKKYAINTLNELYSGIVRFTKLERKTAELTADAIAKNLGGAIAKTLTLDNGSEFSRHEDITKKIGLNIYFADPYSSWQRGSNENNNMLLRGYLPKRYDISNITQQEIDDIALELNNRPRKRLGFKTPIEIYKNYSLKLKGGKVALDVRM